MLTEEKFRNFYSHFNLKFLCINKSLSPWVLTVLSIDRYIAVCRPTLIWMRQSRFAFCVILVCILFSSLFIAPVTIMSNVDIMPDLVGNLHRKCTVNMTRPYDILHVIFCYIVPFVLICSVYIAILRRLYRHTRRTSVVGRRTNINLSRVVKCSVMVVAFYFFCWSGYWSLQIFHILSGGKCMSNTFAD